MGKTKTQLSPQGSSVGLEPCLTKAVVLGSSLLGGTGDLPGCSTPGPRGISRGARKLAQTSTVIKKKKKL